MHLIISCLTTVWLIMIPLTTNGLSNILKSHRSFLLEFSSKIILLLVLGPLNKFIWNFTCQMAIYFLLDSYEVHPYKLWLEIEYFIHDLPSGNLCFLRLIEIIDIVKNNEWSAYYDITKQLPVKQPQSHKNQRFWC